MNRIMENHPVSNLFPIMAEQEIVLLSKDISTNGQKEPIIVLDDMILDGRNRYRACNLLGIEPGKITVNQAKKEIRKEKQVEKENAAIASQPPNESLLWTITENQSVIKCDVLITDPPYGILTESWEPGDIETTTRLWATQWSQCKADFILTFFSQRFMWEGRKWFDESFVGYDFQQLLIWHYPNNKSPQSRMGFKQTWEPIFFYRRKDSQRKIGISGSEWGNGLNDFDCHVTAIPQTNYNGTEMKQHPAQKPVNVMRWLINATTEKGELVVDPFCGSGTTGIAAVQLGRRFHGIETNAEYREISERRIAAYGIREVGNGEIPTENETGS